MENEIEFFEIPISDGIYSVSKCGLIKNNKTNMILKPSTLLGYNYLNLYVNKHIMTCRVHRLVCITFLPNPENKRCVNHINGIKNDNRLENLEWCTHSENNKHAYKIGLNSNKGSRNPAARQIIDIETGFVFDCIKDAAINFNLNYNSLKMAVCYGRSKRFQYI